MIITWLARTFVGYRPVLERGDVDLRHQERRIRHLGDVSVRHGARSGRSKSSL
jgi:hypothetical protein